MRSFFELEIPDFAWKFVRTVRIKYKTYKKFLISTKVQSTQTSAIFELQTSDFAKIKKCIIQKSKNVKIQQYKNTWVPAISPKTQKRAKHKQSKNCKTANNRRKGP